MKISNLVTNESNILGEDCEICNLTCDSRQKLEKSLYFCINGTHVDGHKFALNAVKNGAVAVVCERELELPKEITQIIVPNSRKAMGEIASEFYGKPQKNMKVIMVTGTNGKTTTTYLLKKILEDAGNKVGVIGTNGTQIGDKHINSNLTTPDPIELFEILKEMENDGCNFVCMEASAHAIALNKLSGLVADVAILTNITQDHLDFFGDIENYANTKFKLFNENCSKFAVINVDDSYGDKLFHQCKIPAISFGIDTPADINANYITQNKSGQTFSANISGYIEPVKLQLDGKFNVSNALGAMAVAELLGIDRKQVANSLSKIPPVDGRFNKIDKNGVQVIIDYAHTPDGIRNILLATKELAGNKKVIAVFGCGGNRDAAKRPLMGEVACSLADYSIITSDNPRYEKPEDIIEDVCDGIKNYNNYETIVDRKLAIERALNLAKPGDVVAILGKGNENYLEINGEKLPYCDKDVVEQVKE